jgi:hypothetical protein
MSRRALLIANSVAYSDISKNVPRATVNSVVAELSTSLSGLDEEYSFATHAVVDTEHAAARETIRNYIRKSDKSDLLLLYYFGHAMNDPYRGELHLYFRDSEATDPGSMLSLRDIVNWLEIYKIQRVVMMLDCCYAGTGAKALRFSGSVKDAYIMASVNSQEKAAIDYHGERAYGVFSNFVLQAFTNPGARADGRNVTFKSCFRYIKDEMKAVSKQLPYEFDANLGDEIFFSQTTKPVIVDAFRESTPKKCIYRKLFVIASELFVKGEQSERFLYSRLKQREQVEFMQPKKVRSGVVEYEFVSENAFNRYLKLGVLLGILKREDLLSLTQAGRRMVDRGGKQYNSVLHNLLIEAWIKHGFELSELEDAVYRRIRRGSAPSLRGIHRDVSLRRPLGMSRDLFTILFDLTGYVGALNYSDEKTFFPPLGTSDL